MNNKNIFHKMNKLMWFVVIILLLYILIRVGIMVTSKDIREYGINSAQEWASDIVSHAVLSEIMPGRPNAYIGEIYRMDEIGVEDMQCRQLLNESFNSVYAANDDSTTNTQFVENDENELNSLGDIARGDNIIEETKQMSPKNNVQVISNLLENNSYEYLLNHFYTLDSTTSTPPYLKNPKHLIGMDMKIKKDITKPQVLIYHTHSNEAYSDSRKDNKDDTIVGVGECLKSELTKLGIKTIHNCSTYDVIDGKWNRYSYDTALPEIKKILKNNPDIEVVIDLHRDSGEKKEVTTIDGKKTARIMFFNGVSRSRTGARDNLNNTNLESNLAFSLQLKIEAMKSYNDFTKKIYLKGYRYNLHLKGKSTLIEVGNDKNTIKEAKNAMEPLAMILNNVLKKR